MNLNNNASNNLPVLKKALPNLISLPTMQEEKKATIKHQQHTLQPADLCGWPISLLVSGSNTENDGRLGCVVNVSG